MSGWTKSFHDGRVVLYAGDCLSVLDGLAENSIDAICTDPPYHLASIVKRFGGDGAAAAKDYRGVKEGATGAYARASRGFMGKEWDGGDIAFHSETWAKVLRVLKPGGYIIAFSSSRTFGRMSVAIEDAGFITHPMIGWIFGQGFPKAHRVHAEGCEGWRYGRQALKPALEPIYMGQKPFSEKMGTANVLRWGTGAINIDATRISSESGDEPLKWSSPRGGIWKSDPQAQAQAQALGRWPANVCHDGSDAVLAGFPESTSGSLTASHQINGGFKGAKNCYGSAERGGSNEYAANSGSAARFFYSAKADATDRAFSKHPTVKPVDLMRWLVRMVTPPGGTVLDLFAGTGTTGHAALLEGFNAILIEREAEYLADIERRMVLVFAGEIERASHAKQDSPDALPLFGER